MSHQNYQQQGTEGILADLSTNQHQQVQNQMERQNQQHQRLMQHSGIGSGNAMSQAGSQQSKLLSSQLDGGIAAQGQYQNEQFNVLSMCRIGQETMQDIVSAVENVFNILREIEPPSDIDREVSGIDKRAELQEQLQTVGLLFKDLRFLYDKCNEICQWDVDCTHLESLIPLKEEPEHSETLQTEEYKMLLEENRELVATVKLRNKQLLEIINILRF